MKPSRQNVKKILEEHSRWITSHGKAGKLADVKKWNLDKFNLEKEDFPFAKLQFISLRGANVSEVNFRQADLLGGSFVGAYLYNADLKGANLSGSDLSFSKCMGANFTDANCEGANFEGASLEGTNFEGASLRCANFKGANLSAAEMIDANIEFANFQGANLEGTNFEGTDLYKADFDEAYLIDLISEIKNLSWDDHKDTCFSDTVQNETNLPEIGLDNHHFDKAKLNRKPSIKSSKEDLIADLDPYKPAMIEEAIIDLKEEDLIVDLDAIKPDMIEAAINDLIEKIRSNIHLDQLKAICKHQHGVEKIDKIEFEHGDIVSHNGQVACKLDFIISISYNLSLLLDRKGKLINKYDLKAKQ